MRSGSSGCELQSSGPFSAVVVRDGDNLAGILTAIFQYIHQSIPLHRAPDGQELRLPRLAMAIGFFKDP